MIARIGQAAPLRQTRATGRASAAGGRFRLPDAADTMPEAAVTGAVAGVGLVALQESAADTDPDRSARRRGTEVLAALAALQRAWLGDGDPGTVVARLEGLATAMPPGSDPHLTAILAQIRLRAAIEAWRLGARP